MYKKSQLTEYAVRVIKRLFEFGLLNNILIAKMFNVTKSTISAIRIGKTWKHVVQEPVDFIFTKHKNDEIKRPSVSSETRKKMSFALKNRKRFPVTEETKRKISKTLLEKGNNRGEKSGAAKLTESDVKEIKILLKEGKYTLQEIGNIYNVTRSCIEGIKYGYNWKHIKI